MNSWLGENSRKRSARGDKEIKRRDKERCESFSEFPRGGRFAHETAYAERVWGRHFVVVSHI